MFVSPQIHVEGGLPTMVLFGGGAFGRYLGHLSHLVLIAWWVTPSDITSLSEGSSSAVVQPFLFSYSEASKWQLNTHAFIFFMGSRTPRGGGSPLSQSSAALPFILTRQAADV